MKRLYATMGGILAGGFIGFLSFGDAAFAEQVSRQQILEAPRSQAVFASANRRSSCRTASCGS
jgi:hypothetical protein